MTYSVSSTEEADEDLADAWMAAPDPAAVNDAISEAERILGTSPLSASDSLAEGLRRVKVPPILVYFRVDLAKKWSKYRTSV